jgi:Ca2+-binding RTX toxin-like protein
MDVRVKAVGCAVAVLTAATIGTSLAYGAQVFGNGGLFVTEANEVLNLRVVASRDGAHVTFTDRTVSISPVGRGCTQLSERSVRCRLPRQSSEQQRARVPRVTIRGREQADRITTAGRRLSIQVYGRQGNDTLTGGAAGELLDGEFGNDRLSGGRGNDVLQGGPGNDRLSGGRGNDRLTDAGGRNRLSGGSGTDILDALNGKRDIVNCGSGRRDRAIVDRIDTVRGCERRRFRR